MVKYFCVFLTLIVLFCALVIVLSRDSRAEQSTKVIEQENPSSISSTPTETPQGTHHHISSQDNSSHVIDQTNQPSIMIVSPIDEVQPAQIPQEIGKHLIFPPSEASQTWRGEAKAPNVGKLAPNIDMSWEWEPPPNNSSSPGKLLVYLSSNVSLQDVSLLIHPVTSSTIIHSSRDMTYPELKPKETWLSSHEILPGQNNALVSITYGSGPLKRSISIPLGWDGRGDDRPMSEKPVPGVIRTEKEVLMPAQTTIEP